MKKRCVTLFLAVGVATAVSLSGCGNKDGNNTTQVVESTEDQFAINQGVNVIGNTGGNTTSNSGTNSQNSEDGGSSNTSTTETVVDNRTEWEVQESENAQLDESIAQEEAQEYDEYINSDTKEEVVLTYDRTENGILIFKNTVVEDAGSEGSEGTVNSSDMTEYRVDSTKVTEGVAELNQGDLATLITNMVVDDATNEFIKVWEVRNLTKEMEEQAIEDESKMAAIEAGELSEEEAGWGNEEDLEDSEDLTVETTEEVSE